jgi:hypothetical protein
MSWAWGDPNVIEYITINSKKFGVSRNPYNALKQLQKTETLTWFWVDAICIYVDGHREKTLRNLRLGPPFSEGLHFPSRINSLLLSAFASSYLFLSRSMYPYFEVHGFTIHRRFSISRMKLCPNIEILLIKLNSNAIIYLYCDYSWSKSLIMEPI